MVLAVPNGQSPVNGDWRIQETAITADALIPGGPYDLWQEDEPSRRVKDLVGAFAQLPHLPKMLNRLAILDTLVDECVAGTFVLRLIRSDQSVKTFWRSRPDEVALEEPSLEAILPESATLTELESSLLLPGQLPELWHTDTITLNDLFEYFSGDRVVTIQKESYEEPLTIPGAARSAIEASVHTVRNGQVWLTSGVTSLWAENIPAGLLTESAQLTSGRSTVSLNYRCAAHKPTRCLGQ